MVNLARSFIKLYGPPIAKGLRALEQIALGMSEKTAIRYYSSLIMPAYGEDYGASIVPDVEMPVSEKVRLISTASQALGEYDFFFEWGAEPTMEQVLELIEQIDTALADCGCMYTIITK